MGFGQLEWTVVLVFLGLLTLVAVLSRRLTHSVADFLAASRGAGRYLLTSASGMAWLGAASLIGQFQIYYDGGFTAWWWCQMIVPVLMVVTFSGWVVYRWRATRILTQAQLFELRYNRNYRVFAGIITFSMGIFGVGILPAIGAHFFVSYSGLPETFAAGPFTLQTFHVCVALLIIIAWIYAFIGGQITVMITDFLQGVFCLLVFLTIFIFIMHNVDWSTIVEGLSYAENGKSMVHPYKIHNLDTYNVLYFVWLMVFMIFMGPTNTLMQTSTCSAKTPHDVHMALILGNVRQMVIAGVMVLMPICAFVILHHPKFAAQSVAINSVLSGYTEEIQRQIQVPLAMSSLMPPVLVGAFAAVMLAAFITTNNTLLLTYGGIFIQDIILPFRKEAISQKAHMRLLRISTMGIGVIVFLVSILYKQTLDLQMFWALTSLASAGVIALPMIGALYWRRATTAAAWITAISSLMLCAGAFACTHIENFPLNPIQMTLIGMLILMVIYIAASYMDNVIRKTKRFNLDRLLHRGEYAIEDEQVVIKDSRNWLFRILRIDKEFTLCDRIIYLVIMSSMLISTIVFVIGCIWAWLGKTTDAGWLIYWRIMIWYYFVGGTIVTLWISIGGFIDLFRLIRDIKSSKRNIFDDGRVVGHRNADEIT